MFARLIDRITLVKDPDILFKGVAELAHEAGFNHVIYADRHCGRINLVSTAPDTWTFAYHQKGSFDPLLTLARSRKRAFFWDLPLLQKFAKPEAAALIEAAVQHRMHYGLSVPVQTGFGHLALLTFTARTAEPLDMQADDVLAATAGAMLHLTLQGVQRQFPGSASRTLSPRQAACLRWAAEGKAMGAIAILEDISYWTVVFHLNAARDALNAVNISHAIALAIRKGLI
ncbi:autoinducer binding domain-containing protein (plasmid) [Peteryoungia desertarenae]|uniref:Autoinducer binding domain-containing protein n=1 Tax=Peteryoungia desertarenae TaxID=1813451 RepID=A0ABX6QSZ6_9HYPH|nr:autoinducer binding domain-containing protein [Peteryoungia desertarenae]QLF71723.1 autoinducer binding domain-containing protein [Peteryoungia desertarenae]